MKKIYVAGASSEVRECAAAIQACREMGYEITHDWSATVLEHEARGIGANDTAMTMAERRALATEDLDGVRACDVFWLRVPKGNSLGAWVELGAAIILNKLILVSEDRGQTIFTALSHNRTVSHAYALDFLRMFFTMSPGEP